MLRFEDLNKTQQRWVCLVEQHFSSLLVSTAGLLSYKDICNIHDFFSKCREKDHSFKISKALWLITNNAIRRGLYRFPSSSSTEIEEPQLEPDNESEIQYQAELKKLNIPLKKAK